MDVRYLPYICGIFFSPKFQGMSPETMALYGTVAPFQDPKFPIDFMGIEWDTCR